MAGKRVRKKKISANVKKLKRSELKALRINSLSPEEEAFHGFREDDIEDNGALLANIVRILANDKKLLEEWDSSLPLPAPFEDGDSEIVNLFLDENPLVCEFPQELMDCIPDPNEKVEEISDDIVYSIREGGTANGKSVIECSNGFTYNFQKFSKERQKGPYPRYRYFQCIQRRNNSRNNCRAVLRIEKFEEGDKRMIVKVLGQPHNHDQGFANFIRKDLNDELKKKAVEFPKTKTSFIVDQVLQDNEQFKVFYESKSMLPKYNSMKRTVQLARKELRPPTVKDPEFEINLQHIFHTNFFQSEVRVKKLDILYFLININ